VVGRWAEEGADSTSHILGKRELKGPSRQYAFVCLCECGNTIELQPSVGRQMGNLKMKQVTGNFTGNRLTDNRITTI